MKELSFSILFWRKMNITFDCTCLVDQNPQLITPQIHTSICISWTKTTTATHLSCNIKNMLKEKRQKNFPSTAITALHFSSVWIYCKSLCWRRAFRHPVNARGTFTSYNVCLLRTHKKIKIALIPTGLVSIIHEIQEGRKQVALKLDFERKHIESVCIKLIVR